MLNFNVKRQAFLNSLSVVQGASEKKGSLPILSNLLIESSGKNLIKISATDLEISVITYCEADIITEGKVCINSRKIFSIIKEFPEKETKSNNNLSPEGITISFKLNNYNTTEENGHLISDLDDINGGSANSPENLSNNDFKWDGDKNSTGLAIVSYKKVFFKLTTTPFIDYPTIIDNSFKPSESFNINFKVLKKLISNVIFSVSLNEESKRNMMGVSFSLSEMDGVLSLLLVATDGHRLAISQIPIDNKNNPQEIRYFKIDSDTDVYNLLKTGVIIPKKVLNEVLKLESSSSVNIYINSNNIFFNFEDSGTQIISRLIEGKFPDYKTVLPKDNYKLR